jgi:hypothetical protein
MEAPTAAWTTFRSSPLTKVTVTVSVAGVEGEGDVHSELKHRLNNRGEKTEAEVEKQEEGEVEERREAELEK